MVVDAQVSADETSASTIQGTWLLNTALSDSVKKKFEAFDEPVRGGFRDGGIGAGTSGKLGRATGDKSTREIEFKDDDPDTLARTVSMRKVLSARSIRIEGIDNVEITYDNAITRRLVPNPNGRVFSASGKEVVVDEYGHTVSFWKKAVLVVETTTKNGVDVVERYSYETRTQRLKVASSITPPGGSGIRIVQMYDRGSLE